MKGQREYDNSQPPEPDQCPECDAYLVKGACVECGWGMDEGYDGILGEG